RCRRSPPVSRLPRLRGAAQRASIRGARRRGSRGTVSSSPQSTGAARNYGKNFGWLGPGAFLRIPRPGPVTSGGMSSRLLSTGMLLLLVTSCASAVRPPGSGTGGDEGGSGGDDTGGAAGGSTGGKPGGGTGGNTGGSDPGTGGQTAPDAGATGGAPSVDAAPPAGGSGGGTVPPATTQG